LLTFSELARDKLAEFAANSEEDTLALKIAITGRTDNGFQYDLQLIPPKEQEESDHVYEVDGWTVMISDSSVPYMEGVTLEFKETLMGGGFHFENPNPLWADEIAQRVQVVIDEMVNPAIASHGGKISLVDVADGVVVVSFGGGCQGCSAVDITLKHGVEKMICETIPEITSISDVTDHAAGENPFY